MTEPGKMIPEISGNECDAFSRRARRLLHWRAGEVRRIKRRYWRRFRYKVRRWLKGQEPDA